MKFRRHITALIILSGLTCVSFAQTLTPGMKAPALNATWIKGQSVEKLEKGRIYVIDFWATWCGFCIDGMPHLTQLSKKYADKATFIAMNVWEQPGDDIPERVQKKVDELGEKMDVNVGRDGKEGLIAKNWLNAAKIQGIPTSFVVNGEGNVVWIGHPSELEPVIEELIAGKFNIEASKKRFLAQVTANDKMWQDFKQFGELKKKYEKKNSAETLLEMERMANSLPFTPSAMDDFLNIGLSGQNYPIAEKAIRTALANRNKIPVRMVLIGKYSVLPKNEAAYRKLKEEVFQGAVKMDQDKNDFQWALHLANAAAKSNKVDQAQSFLEEAKRRYEASPKDESTQKFFDSYTEDIKKAIETAKKSGRGG